MPNGVLSFMDFLQKHEEVTLHIKSSQQLMQESLNQIIRSYELIEQSNQCVEEMSKYFTNN